jgi:hypothetical protein
MTTEKDGFLLPNGEKVGKGNVIFPEKEGNFTDRDCGIDGSRNFRLQTSEGTNSNSFLFKHSERYFYISLFAGSTTSFPIEKI